MKSKRGQYREYKTKKDSFDKRALTKPRENESASRRKKPFTLSWPPPSQKVFTKLHLLTLAEWPYGIAIAVRPVKFSNTISLNREVPFHGTFIIISDPLNLLQT
jgi:hypothetical protein